MSNSSTSLSSSLRLATTVFLAALSSLNALASESNLLALPRIPANPARLLEALERNSHERGETLADELREFTNPLTGLELHLSYKSEFLGNVNGGYKRGGAYAGLLQLSAGIDFAKLLDSPSLDGFKLGVSAWYPHGTSFSAGYVHDLNGVSNIDGYDSFRLNELWLEKEFTNGTTIRAGLLAADSEFFVCNSGSLFINSCFGAIPTVSLNFDAPVYPLAAPGIRLAFTPTEQTSVRLAAFSGSVGQQDGSNKHGTHFKFDSSDGILFLGEGSYQTKGDLPGAFTLGGFYHTGRFQNLNDPDRVQRGDYGGYFIIDQTLYHPPATLAADKGSPTAPNRSLNGFVRVGADGWNDRNAVKFYSEAGLAWKGLIPSRPKDSAGVAFSYARTSARATGAGAPSSYEAVLEASYQVVLKDWFTIQPDVQYIINPGADSSVRNALILGVRATFAF